ncbi:MAG: hypothetical protein CMI74_07235 [Candidatus Pelagibacter sp.]|jgi:hypothetical protein|nr:hypothetical protein [Candidatus Pelagibacter sp.]
MAYTSLKFRPGIISDVTSYSNEGGYIDGDKIRFRNGFPEKFGGWVKQNSNTYLGSARRLHNWVALDGSDFLGIGTHLKYYIEEGGTFNDITPEKDPTAAGDITFAATNGSTTITVTDAAHGANVNDFVTFSGVDSNGLGSSGNITQAILQAEFQIVSIISSNSYTITSSVAANSSDTGNGGSSVVGTYQINTGLDATVGGTGWGAGQWSGTTDGALATTINEGGTFSNSDTTLTVTSGSGIEATDIILIEEELLTVTNVATDDLTVTRASSGTTASTHANGTLVRLASGNADSANDFVGWGQASSITAPGAEIRTWSHDNFGEDLIINPRDGAIYYWDKSSGLGVRAKELSASPVFSTRTSVPTIAKQVLVSDQDRHVIAFGCDGLGATSTTTQGNEIQDPLLIRFSSQENPVDFFPTATNTAGDLRLGGGSTFVQAVETKQQILVFTNKTLHSMKFIGPPFTFGLQELSKNITIMSPASAVAVEDVVFWMGVDTFYIYAGGTQQLPCTVKDKVFLDFNFDERDKVHVGVNSEFSEVIWFYPKADSSSVNAYVVYNYAEKVWYYGTLNRDAWIDRGIRTFPIATGNSLLYNHELTNDDDGSAMTSFIESGPMDMGDGDKFVSIKQMLPDITFNGSSNPTPSVSFTLKAKNSAGGNFLQTESKDTSRSTTTPIEQFTGKIDYRLRGRSFAIKVESTGTGVKYKLGTPRVDMRPDGRR